MNQENRLIVKAWNKKNNLQTFFWSQKMGQWRGQCDDHLLSNGLWEHLQSHRRFTRSTCYYSPKGSHFLNYISLPVIEVIMCKVYEFLYIKSLYYWYDQLIHFYYISLFILKCKYYLSILLYNKNLLILHQKFKYASQF